MAEKRVACFQSKKVKICRFFSISTNYYIYLKRYFEIFLTNNCFSIFWRTTALKGLLVARLGIKLTTPALADGLRRPLKGLLMESSMSILTWETYHYALAVK